MEADGMQKGVDPAAYGRAGPMDNVETHLNMHGSMKGAGPPQYPRHSYGYGPPPHPHPHPHPYGSTRHTLPIKSVVTTSFEEREDRMEHRDPSFSHYDMGGRHRRSPPHYAGGGSGGGGGGREDPMHGMEPPHAAYREMYHGYGHMEPAHPLGREAPHHDARDSHMYGRDLHPIREGDAEARHPPPDMLRMTREVRVPPSPRNDPSFINRSLSSASSGNNSFRSQGPLKRSFWHHARPGEDFQSLPNEFMPPKRSKMTPPSGRNRDYVVTARRPPHHEEIMPSDRSPPLSRSPGWFNRAMSWEAARDDYYQRDPNSKVYTGSWSSRSPPSYREERIGGHWGDAPSMPSPRGRYVGHESGYDVSPPGRWHPSEGHGWGHGIQNRDEADTKPMNIETRERESFETEMRRQGTFESGSDGEPPLRYITGPSITPRGMDPYPTNHMSDMTPMPNTERPSNGTLLLALPEDRISLSETLCLVRENVEVFTATVEDVDAPAPGRKHAVSVGQVGLRCIHCRHTTRSSDRVKRAVCYPSSIKRIYRTVIDMKLDHFLHCKFVPRHLKETLAALKANNTRSTGTTMQYFIRAAGLLGMVDSPDGNGVRMMEHGDTTRVSTTGGEKPQLKQTPPRVEDEKSHAVTAPPDSTPNEKDDTKSPGDTMIVRKDSMSSEGTSASPMIAEECVDQKEFFTGQVSLSLPEDKSALSPLRCFLREQVIAFSATEEDIAVRTPTTFSVKIGQVGIACIHCFKQPAKTRLNRAVCFPFSIARIYQSVADIQRFHLGECKMIPDDVKQKFEEFQNSSTKGSKGLATRQYWVTSAKKIGMVDTEKGIRFGRDPTVPEEKSVSLDILAQVASHANSVNRPLVVPDDKPLIAEFLYVVMEQLQACRFTEADRNKRRLKNIGCIGVECKHCAGQVDSRKFFWSSVSAVESNFVSVHTHMLECRCVPEELKEKLVDLKKLRKEQTFALKSGSQKAFFSRVWERLHAHEQAAVAAAEKEWAKARMSSENQEGDMVDPPEAVESDQARVDRTDSVDDDMSKVSTGATPMVSPMVTPEKMDIDASGAPQTPTSPASNEKIKAVNDQMAIVSV